MGIQFEYTNTEKQKIQLKQNKTVFRIIKQSLNYYKIKEYTPGIGPFFFFLTDPFFPISVEEFSLKKNKCCIC